MVRHLFALMVLAQAASAASFGTDVHRIEDSAQLAQFIYRNSNTISPRELISGIRSTDKLRIRPYTIDIPVREIYGTIAYDRLEPALGDDFLGAERRLDVREICAFRDTNDEVWRYHILIFTDTQYDRMASMLERRVEGAKEKAP